MSFKRIQLASLKLLIIFLDVAHLGLLQEQVAVVHQFAERIQRLHNALIVSNDGILFVFQLSQELVGNRSINAEFHLLRIDHHDFQFRRMFLI